MPLTLKVDCIRLYVADLDEGLAFYRDRLGHTLIWRTLEAAGLRLAADESEIVLHTDKMPLEVDLKVESTDEAVACFREARRPCRLLRFRSGERRWSRTCGAISLCSWILARGIW